MSKRYQYLLNLPSNYKQIVTFFTTSFIFFFIYIALIFLNYAHAASLFANNNKIFLAANVENKETNNNTLKYNKENSNSTSLNINEPSLNWFNIRNGLDVGIACLNSEKFNNNFIVLKINPKFFYFTLQMSSKEKEAYSFLDWAKKFDLVACINSSMFLPDLKTSTGYLKDLEHVNNSYLGTTLGAVFLAGPLKKGLPEVDIISRKTEGIQEIIENYSIVIQNYYFLSENNPNHWKTSKLYGSIAIVAKGTDDCIYFIMSQPALTSSSFIDYLNYFNIKLKSAMYVEGGIEAGILFLASEEIKNKLPHLAINYHMDKINHENSGYFLFKGRKRFLNIEGNTNEKIPNVIGIKERKI